MFEITDIHNHSLYGLDDGADSFEKMCRMIDVSFESGVRRICFTPHYFNIESDCTPEDILKSFEDAKRYCAEKYPDMELFVGSEMIYHYDCDISLTKNKLFTVADSRYVLVDFLSTPDARGIVLGVERLLNMGYTPIVAHVERYPCLYGKMDMIKRMSDSGAIIQVNAGSLFDGFLSKTRAQCLKLFKEGLVDVVASDAHGLNTRTPELASAAETVIAKFGEDYARQVFSVIPGKILANKKL